MVLDVEPYTGFWTVGKDPIRPLMTRIRRGIGGRFHLGMAVDPRPQHKPRIYPDEWRPFINSVHLQLYWESFQRPLEDVLEEGFSTWADHGLPVFPCCSKSTRAEMIRARELAVETYKVTGVSWWRFGVIGPVEFPAINYPVTPGEPVPEPEPPPAQGRYGIEVVVTPEHPNYRDGAHGGQDVDDLLSTSKARGAGRPNTSRPSAPAARCGRPGPAACAQRVVRSLAFVPSRHATTDARVIRCMASGQVWRA